MGYKCSTTNILTAVAVLSVMLCACSTKPELPKENDMRLSYGKSSVVWSGYGPYGCRPVTVWLYIPFSADVSTMPVLFAMHGADRNAEYQVDSWGEVAEDKGIAVIAPCLDRAGYPSLEYQFGGVSSSEYSYVPRPPESYTYNMVEALFDWFRAQTGNRTETYDIWGHSAGGQFTHRMLLFMPQARVNRAVCSNSGFYTVPDSGGLVGSDGLVYDWPYSLRYVSSTESGERTYSAVDIEHLKTYFSRDMTVHLGTADLASSRAEDSSFPDQPGAMAQGVNRYERGRFFYARSKEIAEGLNLPFNWKIAEVKGVGHNSRGMVQRGDNSAASLLYYRQAGKSSNKNEL